MKIAIAGNSETACLEFILVKGFIVKSSFNGDILTLSAYKGEDSVHASNFFELLGLVTLYEAYGADWGKDQKYDDPWKLIQYED